MGRLAACLLAASVLVLPPADARGQGYLNVLCDYSYDGAAGECPSVWSDCPRAGRAAF